MIELRREGTGRFTALFFVAHFDVSVCSTWQLHGYCVIYLYKKAVEFNGFKFLLKKRQNIIYI